MRSFGHWSPRYILDRTNEFIYRRLNPDLPWLTRQANEILDGFLTGNQVVLEFGSGRSTLWFARRAASLTSVEHDPTWHARILAEIPRMRGSKVTYLLREDGPAYVQVADTFADGSVDLVLVDGAQRDACALAAIPKLRSGGLLVVDNANWFLPESSRSPASRGATGSPSTPHWARFMDSIAGWRRIWTSNGVTDTSLYFKP